MASRCRGQFPKVVHGLTDRQKTKNRAKARKKHDDRAKTFRLPKSSLSDLRDLWPGVKHRPLK